MFEADAAADKLFARCRSNHHGNIPSYFLDTRSFRIRLALALLWRLLREVMPPMHRVKIELAKKGRDRDVLSNS